MELTFTATVVRASIARAATMTVGIVTPGVACLYGIAPAPALPRLVTFSALFLSFAILRHLAAFVLEDIDHD